MTSSRLNYVDGQELRASDFEAEDEYFASLERAVRSGLHTSGIASGLQVALGDDRRSITVAAGVAFDESGRAITLDQAQSITLAGFAAADYYVFIRYAEGVGSTPKRIVAEPVIELRNYARAAGSGVALAKITVASDATVTAIERRLRKQCGLELGTASFVSELLEPVAPAISASSAGELSIAAAALEIDGSLNVAGTLAVNVEHPWGALDVVSDGGLLLRIADAQDKPLLAATRAAQLGVGTDTPSAALDVAGGDIQVDAGGELFFAADGALESGSGPHALRLSSSAKRLTIEEAGDIQLFTGGQVDPLVVLHKSGNVGIGLKTDEPDARLAVAGMVQVLAGGIDFGGGYVQSTAAISTTVRIGTVIDFWRPADSQTTIPPEFAICDGSVVNDSASPLHNKALPNLTSCFVRGTTEYDSIGIQGGAQSHAHAIDALPLHTHFTGHDHGSFRTETTSSLGDSGSDSTDSKQSSKWHSHWIEDNIQSSPEQTSSQNDGVVEPAVPTDVQSNLPPYYGLLKIIRIK